MQIQAMNSMNSNYQKCNTQNKATNNVSFGFVGGPGRTISEGNKISEEFCKETAKVAKKIGKAIVSFFKS